MTQKKKMPDYESMVSGTIDSDNKLGSKFGNIMIPRGMKFIQPKIGEHIKMDFLLYEVTNPQHLDRKVENGVAVEGSYHYRMPYWCHKMVGVNNETVTCLKMFNKPCPICEYHAEIRKSEEASEEEKNKFAAKNWVLYVVIPIDHDSYEEEMYLFNFSHWNFQLQLKEELEEKPKFRRFPDLENGYTVDVRFGKGTFKGGKPFPKATRIDFMEREDANGNSYAYPQDILDEVPKLDDLLIVKSYDELYTMIHGSGMESEQYTSPDEEAGQETKKAAKSYRTPKKSVPVKPKQSKQEESEDETPFKEEESSGEEEKPKKQPAKSKTTKTASSGKKQVKKTSKTQKSEPQEESEDDKSESEYECPGGGTFGKDWNELEYCQECEIFDECLDDNRKKWA